MSIRRIFLRRDTAANFASTNPVLSEGEPAFDTTNQILKVGDGVTAWNSLSQFQGPQGVAGQNGADGADGQNGIDGQDGVQISSYTKANLPLNASAGTNALVTDGTTTNTPTMSYFYNGSWYRTFDNSEIVNQTVDIYLLAGQSNAHGHANVSDLSTAQATQDGIFYTSWHDNTSNASTTQYYSPWATSLVAGSTRGDDGSSSLGGSSKFGPEIGFVERANAINLTNGQPIGVLKHAIGASSLTDDGSADGGLSDWDLTATGDKRGDALRAFKLAIADGLTKLTNGGYSYRLAGFIWWQGESGGADSDLIAFIDHMRTWLDDNYTLDMPKAQFPFVITGTTTYWRTTYKTNVADQDSYVGFVNTQDNASPSWADRTLVHPGSNETYTADASDVSRGYTGSVGDTVGSPDFKGDGVNDMFTIGRAYADQMQLAITGSTNSAWTPASINTRLWVDMDDQSTFTTSGGYVTQFADKSGNNYSFNADAGATLTAVNSAQNGKNILRFDNNTDATSNTLINFSNTAVHKWYFVLKVTNSDTHDALIKYQKPSANLMMIMFNFSGSGVFSGDWYTLQGNVTDNTANVINQWVMFSVEFDVPNTEANFFMNTVPYRENFSITNLSGFGAGNVKFNDHINNGDSDWGEAIFVEDVSQSNSDKIEGYLAHKWGLTADLPSAHPYKTSAP